MLSTVPGTVADTEEYTSLFLPSRSLRFSLEFRTHMWQIYQLWKALVLTECQMSNNEYCIPKFRLFSLVDSVWCPAQVPYQADPPVHRLLQMLTAEDSHLYASPKECPWPTWGGCSEPVIDGNGSGGVCVCVCQFLWCSWGSRASLGIRLGLHSYSGTASLPGFFPRHILPPSHLCKFLLRACLREKGVLSFGPCF